MSNSKLRGVIAAVATPINADGSPDVARATKLARHLVDNGCDGLNVLGTTGEATSFSLEERKRVMTAYRDAGLPMERLMVGTGAASAAGTVGAAVACGAGRAPVGDVRRAHRRAQGFLRRHGLCARRRHARAKFQGV